MFVTFKTNLSRESKYRKGFFKISLLLLKQMNTQMLIMLRYNTFVNWACWVFFVSSAIYVAIPQYYFFFILLNTTMFMVCCGVKGCLHQCTGTCNQPRNVCKANKT